jgi:hypothetical protein
MNTVPFVLLLVGLLLVGLGALSWRSAGRGAVLAGAIFVATGVYFQLKSLGSGAQYPVLAAVVVLAFYPLARGGPSAFRLLRTELLLAAATVVVVVGSLLVPDDASGIRSALGILVGVFAVAFLAVVVFRVVRMAFTAARRANGAGH